jgi:hypothetical protein
MNWWKKVAEISSTYYGYWLGPDGKDYPVKNPQSHGLWCRERGYNGYEAAWRDGFIRVVASGGWKTTLGPNCGCEGYKVTQPQISALMAMFKAADCENVYVELNGVKTPPSKLTDYRSRNLFPIKSVPSILYSAMNGGDSSPSAAGSKSHQMDLTDPVPELPPAPAPKPVVPPAPIAPPAAVRAPAGLSRDQLRQQMRGKVNPLKRKAQQQPPRFPKSFAEQYGYWILPDGKMVPVKQFGHVDAYYNHTQDQEPQNSSTEPYEKAWAMGWVRIVSNLDHMGEIESEQPLTAAQVQSALMIFAKEQPAQIWIRQGEKSSYSRLDQLQEALTSA